MGGGAVSGSDATGEIDTREMLIAAITPTGAQQRIHFHRMTRVEAIQVRELISKLSNMLNWLAICWLN